MISETDHDLLASATLAHVATLGVHGEPRSTPMWFAWDGHYIRLSQTTRQYRYRSLLRDPRIALSMVDLHNPYRSLEIRGIAIAFEEDTDRVFVDHLAHKYLGVDRYPWHREGDVHMVIVVEPCE
jgi:PPOX class probable F420-dependent enzyme